MSTLEAQVNLLASLIERLDTVRDVSAGNLPVHLRNAITNVSALAEELASTQVQDALAAAETEQGIRAIDLQNSRREIRQRKNQVEVAPPIQRPEIKKRPYPPKLGVPPPQVLTQKSLKEFVLNFNQADLGSSLSIWTPTSAAVGQNGPLRMVVPNILVAYVNLRSGNSNSAVKVESVTVTGIREQVYVLDTTSVGGFDHDFSGQSPSLLSFAHYHSTYSEHLLKTWTRTYWICCGSE
ncbi:unnamed protein product [Rhizoctonia solani]|uniref:Uncharacterized protein n=1 Tax=Rhizoctonia solani TaxID=456999 RepID=A0A8H3D7B0_9AGAM|nr:unnamed protein product [Rhizoctonia solani]